MTASSAGSSPAIESSSSSRHLTGRRVKKRVTLYEVDGQNDSTNSSEESCNDTSPLLRRRASSATSRRKRGTSSVWQTQKLGASRNIAQVRDFLRSDVGKGVFKCSVAYFLGSLATFVPYLRDLLGQQDGKHMVATITVYFHPARSLGSMFDALICAFAAFIYAAFICLTSMSISVFFSDVLDLMAVGHAIVLIVFCGGGLGFLGWVKQRKGDPLVNVACSLASLAIITVTTKEGAVQAGDFSFAKISQVLKMIVMGVVATMAVSVILFPVSGRLNLHRNINTVTESLSDMLAFITSTFLSGFEEGLQENPFQTISERHLKTYSTLGKNLKEAKYEHYLLGNERQYMIEARLTHCVQRVTQSIGGLRSAAAMQFDVSKQTVPSVANPHSGLYSWPGTPSVAGSSSTAPVRTSSEDFSALLSAIDERSDEDNAVDGNTNGQLSGRATNFRSPSEIFDLFIQHLGPSMRSLAFTLKEILDEEPFDRSSKRQITLNPKLRPSLVRAIDLYTGARKDALKAVYSQKDLDRKRPMEVEADWEDVAASCGHFSFSLLEVAEHVKQYLSILDELQLEVDERSAGRTWSWLKFWRPTQTSQTTPEDPEAEPMIDQANDSDIPIPMKADRKAVQSTSSQERDPEKPLTKQRLFRRLWDALAIFRRDDTKFAIKVGVGAALYAMPSFIPATRPFYSKWRGEWGLLSYMLVCSMTIGASNTTGYSRFLGTCLGAVCAIAAWDVSNANAFVLAFLGWCMALWTSYVIVGKGKGPMGRFIMLTYNLSALYAYSLSVKDDESDGDDEGGLRPIIAKIAAHRVVAVLSGCIWGLIITRFVWPISAREKLKDGLSLLWLRMGLIWKRDPLMTITEGNALHHYMDLREEFELQRFLSTLEKLQVSAKSEFELKGPFPEKQYGRILTSTSRILDAFHAMNVMILKKDLKTNGNGNGNGNGSRGETALLKATARERAQLCSRISHLFSVLASSMALSYPLNDDTLPNTEHARDRLLARIFAYRKHEAVANGTGSDEDYALLYTYALTTAQLSREIGEVLLAEIEALFGVLDEEALKLE